jgi:hypothetical protein
VKLARGVIGYEKLWGMGYLATQLPVANYPAEGENSNLELYRARARMGPVWAARELDCETVGAINWIMTPSS